MPKNTEMINKTFGMLTVVSELPERTKHGEVRYRARCACGEWSPAVVGKSLRRGLTRSCGCGSRKGPPAKHGFANQSGNSHYSRWKNMKRRTSSPQAISYENYGGRGIKMYPGWFNNFIFFKNWLDENLGPCPEGHSLDRIDNDGHYCPGNLRWASRSVQSLNRRTWSRK